MATLSDSGAGPYSMLLKISLTLGLVTFFTLSIASPANNQLEFVSANRTSKTFLTITLNSKFWVGVLKMWILENFVWAGWRDAGGVC